MSKISGISLVLATMNRPGELTRFLESYLPQAAEDCQLIIVDQSKVEVHYEIKGIIDQLAGNGVDILLLHSSEKGLSRARNLGLSHAKYEIVGFPDDDCWYGEDVVHKVRAWFEAYDDIGFLTGVYTEPGVVNKRFPSESFYYLRCRQSSVASSVSLFVRQSMFDGIMRFDENIGAGTMLPIGEETDLVMRAILSGVKGIYRPDHVIYHKIARDQTWDPETRRKREEARGYVLGKNARSFVEHVNIFLGLIKLALSDCDYKLVYARLKGLRMGMRLYA